MKIIILLTVFASIALHTTAQFPINHDYELADSAVIRVHPSYERKSKLHRILFGENYRKEWAAETRLPILYISKLYGGLKPDKMGGGMQSKSLRLIDENGKEWVIRSVEKSPDALLPAGLKNSFARDWVDDAMSAQHPYSALIVPPLAEAINVPHTTPVIGVVAPDKALDTFAHIFSGMVVLLEEREPIGETDNTSKMLRKLKEDNDNKIDAVTFLRARMLDALIGDWDRHEDQWRWYPGESKDKLYRSVPRDRDQVFHLTQGIFPKIASRDYLLPTLRNFDRDFTKVKWLFFKTRFGESYPECQFSKEQWMEQAAAVQRALTNEVLEKSLRQLPKSSYDLRYAELLEKLVSRRNLLTSRMEEYYNFTQKVVDIQTSDKNERIEVKDAVEGSIEVIIHKINKHNEVTEKLMNKIYNADLTKEIRIFTGNGNDSVFVNTGRSNIKLRLIGGDGDKYYNISNTNKKIRIYNRNTRTIYDGQMSKVRRFINDDSLNTAFTPVNLYNIWQPLLTAGLNVDDGVLVGGGLKFIHQEGFRKYPYSSKHQFLLSHSFALNAFRFKFNSEWTHAVGKADIVIDALLRAPANKQNFFGRGNETKYDQETHTISYYRARINTYELSSVLRWTIGEKQWINVGPTMYYYTFSEKENVNRILRNSDQIGSYDSSIVKQNKFHIGLLAHYLQDRRDSKIIPTRGHFISIKLQALKGVEKYLQSFAQFVPEVAFYHSLNRSQTIVLAYRIGGVLSMGNPTFYQSAFIGGHENLLGFRQFRFAGKHSLYSNLELRIKVAEIASYILPGQLGLTGFWDAGRVWVDDDKSKKWHNGFGGGLYFAPATLFSVNLLAAFSEEGMYPYLTLGFRF